MTAGRWRSICVFLGRVPLWVLAVVMLCSAAVPVRAGATLEVRDARLGAHVGHTRFVLELNDKVSPTYFSLPNEFDSHYRIVIDLPEVDWQVPRGVQFPGVGLVDQVRYALNKPGHSRVVLDLTEPARIMELQLLPPSSGHVYRLVIDIEPIDTATFLADAGWPDDEAAQPVTPRPRPNPPARKWVVVLDPGHGGKDPGTTGITGKIEKDIVLDAADEIKEALEARGTYTVYLTRDDDTFIGLKDRVAKARALKADLFVSLHADAVEHQPQVRGTSVYTLSDTASDREAEALAQKENAVDIADANVGNDVLKILIDLAQRDTMNNSVRFARTLLPHLVFGNIHLLKNTHRFAGFRVLTAPDVPSVLVELGYLSNAADESLLSSDVWRADIATAMVRGIDDYFATRSTAFVLSD